MTRPLAAWGWAGLAAALAPVLRLHLRRRAGRGKEDAARLGERFGIDAEPRPDGRLVWIHAASVGETMSILPVLAAMPPDIRVLLTTGTVTSAQLAAQRLAGMGGWVRHRFAPLDVPGWVGRFLDHWRPDAAAFVESELWPNQLAACRARGIPMMLVNARLSARSFGVWSRFPGLARWMMGSFAAVQARGQEDAERFEALGAPQVDTPGDLKLAAPPLPVDDAELARLRRGLAGRPVWVAASTHPGEEDLVVTAHQRLVTRVPGLLTILAPRHPDRGAELGARLVLPRRSQGDGPPAEGVWLADTLGEMGLWYRLGPIVFIGRSLLPPGGGQNPLEPARLGCAVLSGPHTGNFTEHVAALSGAEAMRVVGDVEGLVAAVAALFANPAEAERMGRLGAELTGRLADLPERTAARICALAGAR